MEFIASTSVVGKMTKELGEECRRQQVPELTMGDEGFVGVHIGAGQHSEARTGLYLEICAAACQAGTDVLRNGGTALEAASHATLVLEDAGETNAGYGSNLTEAGTVEMDAGLMDGHSLLFGAVGAITGIKNPILVAKKLVEEQKKGLLPLGRVPPGFLVGEGAREWAVRHGVETVPTESLVSEKAAKLYKHYKKKLDAFRLSVQQANLKRRRQEGGRGHHTKKEEIDMHNCKRVRMEYDMGAENVVRSHDGASKALDGNVSTTGLDGTTDDWRCTTTDSTTEDSTTRLSPSSSSTKTDDINNEVVDHETDTARSGDELDNEDEIKDTVGDDEINELEDHVTDTVGVVVLDRRGNVAASVSSGGIALKQPGRVGQASCFGCGCWAQRQFHHSNYGVGVSTTGCGEHLVRTFLAKECGEELSIAENPLQALQKVMKERFAESEFLAGVPEKLGGAICMQYDKERKKGEFLWTHTTASMGIGFQTTSEEDATVKMSRLPVAAQQGTSILVEAIPFSTMSDI